MCAPTPNYRFSLQAIIIELKACSDSRFSLREKHVYCMRSSYIAQRGEKEKFYYVAKNEAIEYAEKESNRAAAKKYKVNAKRIREWRKSKESIKELKNKHKGQGRQRLDGGGRKVTDEKLDEIILEWIHNRRANGLRVSRKLIMVKAKYLYDERCQEGE